MKAKKTLSLLLLATAAGNLFTACSNQDDQSEAQQTAKPEAITFAAATDAATRAGKTGAISAIGDLQEAHFGVFGYYSDNMYYSPYQHPNFMYNEEVKYSGSGSAWTYDVPKYWPNEYGANATTGDVDRLSFFAYAPYVEVTPANGQLTSEYTGDAATTGITRLSRATDSGDPQVHYVASFTPANCVDLMWGVVPAAYEFKGVDGNTVETTEGMPLLNLYKPANDQTVKFAFQHALTALNVQVDATVDGSATTDIDTHTRIYVRSVTFEGFAMQGTLSLNNTKAASPLWLNYMGNATLPTTAVTIYDQRRDGHEATTEDNNELPGGLNSALVQNGLADMAGVTDVAQNLFAGTNLDDAVYVIPNGAQLKLTVVYDVETRDDKLVGDLLSDGKTHGSVIQNSVTKTFTGVTLEAGNKYTLKLHLGMTTAKFEGTVSDWTDTTDPIQLTIDPSTTVDPGSAGARQK